MEACLTAMAEGLLFMKKLGSLAAGAIAKGAPALGSAGGTATKLGASAVMSRFNAAKSGVNDARDFMRDRQLTKELHNSEFGGIAKDFGIKMIRSNPQEINRIFQKANVRMQNKGDGVTAFYDRHGLLGIKDKDGSYHGAKFLSEEDRKKYGTLDLNQTYGLIDTTSYDFIQAKGSTPINTDNRIGVIKNMEILRNLNKTM